MILNHISDRPTYSEEHWHIIERAYIKACELLGQPPASYENADRLARTIMRLFDQGSRDFQILAAIAAHHENILNRRSSEYHRLI
jgi:hypothetical protein